VSDSSDAPGKVSILHNCEDSINGKYGQYIAKSRIYTDGSEDWFHVSGFFVLKDRERVLSFDEHQNQLDYDKDVVFLTEEFFCNEIIHRFDLETTFLENYNPEITKGNIRSSGGTPFDRSYMNVNVFVQGSDPVPLGVICLLDVGDDTPLRYESDEEISKRLWKMVNDITKFQKVDPGVVRKMVNFSNKSYREMVNEEHDVIHQLIDQMGGITKFPVYIVKVHGERDFYRAFAKIQYNICPHVLVGHNSNGFDMTFILRRLEYLGGDMFEEFHRIATGKNMSFGEMFKYRVIRKEKITIAQSENSAKFIYIKFDGMLFWDSMTIFQCGYPGKQSSLNYMLDTLEIPSKVGLSYERIDEIVHLSIKNRKIEKEINNLDLSIPGNFIRLGELNEEKKDIFGHDGERLKFVLDGGIYNCEYAQPFRGGKTSMLNCLIAKNYNKSCYDQPISYGIKKKKKFQGAEVLNPETGYYMDPIYTIDFASLYPSIMREYNMGPDTLRYEEPVEKHYTIPLHDNNTGIMQNIYFIHEDYFGVDDIVYGILEQKQLAYKSSANAPYGGLGSPFLGIAVDIISQCMTFVGRSQINDLRNFIQSYLTGQFNQEQPNVEFEEYSQVIYGDTDSCLARLPRRILQKILEKYYVRLCGIGCNPELESTRSQIIFKMYDELTKEGSSFRKKICSAYNEFNRKRGIKIITGDGGLPSYSFSENFAGARDLISRDAKLFNKRLLFNEMIDAFMRENDDFKKYAYMKRFSNIHVRGLQIVRRDANNLTKVMQQMTYSRLFDYREKSKFITEKKIKQFEEFFDFFINSRNNKNNWLRSCLKDAIRCVGGFIKENLSLGNLYIVEDSVRVNSREVSTSTIIEKMKHTLFENDSYNIVNGKLVLYEDKVLGKRHHFSNEINWKEKTSFEYVDSDIWFKNTRLKYKGNVERKGNVSVKTMVNRLQREGKSVPSGRVNIMVRKMPGNRSVGERMILSTRYNPETDIIDVTYYMKKFSSFVESCLNIDDKEAWSFIRESLDAFTLTKSIKRDFKEIDLGL
ncbi:23730_t:CDS:2, partial [Gigaspora rosea]